jgi:hypothetical protein
MATLDVFIAERRTTFAFLASWPHLMCLHITERILAAWPPLTCLLLSAFQNGMAAFYCRLSNSIQPRAAVSATEVIDGHAVVKVVMRWPRWGGWCRRSPEFNHNSACFVTPDSDLQEHAWLGISAVEIGLATSALRWRSYGETWSHGWCIEMMPSQQQERACEGGCGHFMQTSLEMALVHVAWWET